MSAVFAATVPRCLAAVLLFGAAAAAARPAPTPTLSRVDAIERSDAAGDFPAALSLSAELLDATAHDSNGRVLALQARADVLLDAGEWTKQGTALRDAVAQLADVRLRDALGIACDVNEASSAGKPAAMLDAAQKGLALGGPLPPAFAAEMHAAAAKAQLQSNRLDAAHADAEAALAAWQREKTMRARRFEVVVQQLLAQIEQQQGNAESALTHAARADDLAAAAFGPAALLRSRARDTHASVLESLDRFAEARALREAMLKATRDRYGERHARTAQVEGLLAAHLQRTGNYAPAREHYAAAEAIQNALPEITSRERVILANNFANLLQEMDDEDGALAHYRIALDLVTDKRTRAIILNNMGNTEFRLKRYDAAIADFNLALPLREEADGKDSPGLSFALEGLGSSALALKQFAEAERYFSRAVALRSQASAPNHSQLNVLNFGLALAHWGQGHEAEAFALAVQTAEHQQSLLNSLATGFSEQQSVAFDNILVPATALVVTIAAAHADAAQIATAWRLVMVERGLIARAEARRLAIARASGDAQLTRLYRAWRAANAELGDGWLSSRTSAARMSELQAAAEAAERDLWVRLGYRQDDAATAARPVEALAQALPPDGVLVAYTEGVGSDAARIVNAGSAQSAEDLYAFVLRPHAAPSLRRVGRIDAVAAQARAWYALLRDPRSDAGAIRRRGNDLRSELLGEDGAAGARTLFVVPTGELFRMSFAALPEPGGERYWIESGLRVHTLAHESDLAIAAAPSVAGKVLLAGAPQFGGSAPASGTDGGGASRQLCARVAEQGFATIPGAALELDGLQGVLRSALGGAAHVEVLDGAKATKERVLGALDGAAIVHLATHGFSFDESCGAEGARGVLIERAPGGSAPNPQALSGLAFAGADVGTGHAPVGILSAGELSAADLSRANWVALSACDSGLGPIGHTEGVFGMRRALRLAGARTVVMSLWEADDAATADLMHALYSARFGEHRSVPDALAEAMLQTLAARRAAQQPTHPYYWAAFVAEGGWR